MDHSEQKRLEARIEGRVQGVCFRHYTRKRAQELGLHGWVRNERDGSVSVTAEGPQQSLEGLLEFLHQGPQGARVEQVSAQWGQYTGDLEPFAVAR